MRSLTLSCLSSDAVVPAPAEARSLYARADVPARHQHTIDEDTSPSAWVETRNKVVSKLGSGFLIALIGGRGTGKTQIARQAVMVATGKDGHPALYSRAMTFFLRLRETFSLPEVPELAVIDAFRAPRLLVLDEIQVRGETEWENKMLDHLLDLRYGDMTDTLLIANLRPKELRKTLGESIVDRMQETGGIIECTWPSFRKR